jgi:hypothetical protein
MALAQKLTTAFTIILLQTTGFLESFKKEFFQLFYRILIYFRLLTSNLSCTKGCFKMVECSRDIA